MPLRRIRPTSRELLSCCPSRQGVASNRTRTISRRGETQGLFISQTQRDSKRGRGRLAAAWHCGLWWSGLFTSSVLICELLSSMVRLLAQLQPIHSPALLRRTPRAWSPPPSPAPDRFVAASPSPLPLPLHSRRSAVVASSLPTHPYGIATTATTHLPSCRRPTR